MTPKELIDHFKTKVMAAAQCGVSENTIKNWENAGKIPYHRQLAIQVITKNKLKADKE